MLDRVDPRAHEHLRRGIAVAVRRGLPAPAVRLVDDGVQLRLRELHVVHRIGEREDAARRDELDHARPVLDLPAHGRSARVGTVTDPFADAQRRNRIRGVRIEVRVTSTAAHRVHGSHHAWTGDRSRIDRSLQPQVDEVGRAEVPDRGESRLQRAARVLGSVLRLLGGPAQDQVQAVAVPAGAALEGEVRVRVHQARQERGVTKVDRLRSRGHRSADLDDPFVAPHCARAQTRRTGTPVLVSSPRRVRRGPANVLRSVAWTSSFRATSKSLGGSRRRSSCSSR